MKNPKVIIALIMSIFVCLLVFSSCSSNATSTNSTTATSAASTTESSTPTSTEATSTEKNNKDIVLGNVVITLANGYHQADTMHFEKYAKEKYGVQTIIMDGEENTEKIVNAIDQLIAKGVDAIVVQCIFGDTINESIYAAHEAGIPILTFYNKQTEAKNPFLTINEAKTSFQMGKLAAEKWQEAHPGTPINMAVIEYEGVLTVETQRSNPFIEGVLSVDPKAVLASRLDGGGTREAAMAVAQDMLQAHPEINILYGVSSDYALGALAAFEAIGRGKAENGVPITEIVIGTDAPTSELVKLFDPSSSFKITQGLTPKDNAEMKVDLMMKMINGELAMDKDEKFEAFDMMIDYWNSDIDEIQEWTEIQYSSKINLKDEINK